MPGRRKIGVCRCAGSVVRCWRRRRASGRGSLLQEASTASVGWQTGRGDVRLPTRRLEPASTTVRWGPAALRRKTVTGLRPWRARVFQGCRCRRTGSTGSARMSRGTASSRSHGAGAVRPRRLRHALTLPYLQNRSHSYRGGEPGGGRVPRSAGPVPAVCARSAWVRPSVAHKRQDFLIRGQVERERGR